VVALGRLDSSFWWLAVISAVEVLWSWLATHWVDKHKK
jgi:hypothetical protein